MEWSLKTRSHTHTHKKKKKPWSQALKNSNTSKHRVYFKNMVYVQLWYTRVQHNFLVMLPVCCPIHNLVMDTKWRESINTSFLNEHFKLVLKRATFISNKQLLFTQWALLNIWWTCLLNWCIHLIYLTNIFSLFLVFFFYFMCFVHLELNNVLCSYLI